jgi:hypothetical protein
MQKNYGGGDFVDAGAEDGAGAMTERLAHRRLAAQTEGEK